MLASASHTGPAGFGPIFVLLSNVQTVWHCHRSIDGWGVAVARWGPGRRRSRLFFGSVSGPFAGAEFAFECRFEVIANRSDADQNFSLIPVTNVAILSFR